MNVLLLIVCSVLTAVAGCWLCGELLPAGSVRQVGQILCVVSGFTVFAASRRMFP